MSSALKPEERASVPCGDCHRCCQHDAIVLHPECGDVISTYETEQIAHPLTGKPAHQLKHKPNGECIYLGSTGCTIWHRAPAICREFDCRRMFLKFSRIERKRLVKTGLFSKEVFDAGRARLASLPTTHARTEGE